MLYCHKIFLKVKILYSVKYELLNIRSTNQYTIGIDLLSVMISIRIRNKASIVISKQRIWEIGITSKL